MSTLRCRKARRSARRTLARSLAADGAMVFNPAGDTCTLPRWVPQVAAASGIVNSPQRSRQTLRSSPLPCPTVRRGSRSTPAARDRLSLLTTLRNSVSIVDTREQGSADHQRVLFTPDGARVKTGRRLLLRRQPTSRQWHSACSSRHTFADTDHLAWDRKVIRMRTETNNNPYVANSPEDDARVFIP